jgi:hypothetical protein
MSTFAARSNLVARNAARWAAMTVKPAFVPMLDRTARRLVAPDAKARYQQVATATGAATPSLRVLNLVHTQRPTFLP